MPHHKWYLDFVVAKGVQFLVASIAMMLSRVGERFYNDRSYLPLGDPSNINTVILGDIVGYGWLAVISAQIVAHVVWREDNHGQNITLDLGGGLCYFVIAFYTVIYWAGQKWEDAQPTMLTAGCLCFLQGILLVATAINYDFDRMRLLKAKENNGFGHST